jgi:hypothetical protein
MVLREAVAHAIEWVREGAHLETRTLERALRPQPETKKARKEIAITITGPGASGVPPREGG